MLLQSYTKDIFRPECNPSFESVHCIARLDQDVSAALPYLNAELGGTQYFRDPPAVMLRVHGKIIKVGADEIAINALQDEAEAEKILQWLKNEINRVWEEKDNITPSEESRVTPQVFKILKLLPKTNCRKADFPPAWSLPPRRQKAAAEQTTARRSPRKTRKNWKPILPGLPSDKLQADTNPRKTENRNKEVVIWQNLQQKNYRFSTGS